MTTSIIAFPFLTTEAVVVVDKAEKRTCNTWYGRHGWDKI